MNVGCLGRCLGRYLGGYLGCLALLGITLCGEAAQVTYEYDDAGRLKQVTYPNTSQRTYTLDAAGNRTQMQDAQSAGALQFSLAAYSGPENGAPVAITVTRSGSSAGAVAVSYATGNGTASGADYTAASGTLNWANGDSAAKSFTVTFLDDAVYEGDETINLTLSNPTGGASLGGPAGAVLTIVENEPVPDTTPPSVPTGLAASAANPTTVNLTWTASTDNVGVTGYRVERCPGAGCVNFGQIGTSATPAYADTTASGSTVYNYRVRANDAASLLSGYSNTASVTTPDGTAPSVPTGLVASAPTSNQVNLSWTASTDTGGSGLAGYKIYRNGSQIDTSSTASYSDTTTNGTTSYSYAVAAYDNAGNTSAPSAATGLTTLDTILPTVPSGLTGAPISSSQVNLSWTGSTDSGGSGLAGYKIYRNGSGSPIGTSGTTSYSDTTTSGMTTYSYTVAAYDNAGNTSAPSASVNVTTVDTIAPSVPGGLTATSVTANQVTFTWNASTDSGGSGFFRYEVLRNGILLAPPTTSTAFTDSAVGGSTSYSYTVRAKDNAGNTSAQSAALNVTTPVGPPSTPTRLRVTQTLNFPSFAVQWDASTGGTVNHYTLEEQQTAPVASLVTYNTGLAVSKSFNKPNTYGEFYYRIRACATTDETACSAYSSMVYVVTCNTTTGCQ